MIVIQNAMPVELAEGLRSTFIAAPYGRVEQVIEDMYPGSKERYVAQVKKSSELKSARPFKDAVAAIDAELNHRGFTDGVLACMAVKFDAGDFLREHVDPGVGIVLYLSKDWVWDWGGLLLSRVGEGYIATRPVFNQLVIIENKASHFVTPVTTYAKEPRYVLIGLKK